MKETKNIFYVVSMYYEFSNEAPYINTAVFQSKKKAMAFMEETAKEFVEDEPGTKMKTGEDTISLETNDGKCFFAVSTTIAEIKG